MKMSNRCFDTLKWLVLVVIPSITTAYVGLSAVWGWPYAEAIAKTSAIVCTMIGAILGISTIQYKKNSTLQPPDEE